jgi:hypothetical protein
VILVVISIYLGVGFYALRPHQIGARLPSRGGGTASEVGAPVGEGNPKGSQGGLIRAVVQRQSHAGLVIGIS